LGNTKENLAPPCTAAAMTLPLPNAESPRHFDVLRAGGLRGVDGFA
jgi:hypothetical protein